MLIRKMNYRICCSKDVPLPALKLGKEIGALKGFKADMAMFDMWQVDYVSEFNDPHHYSKGMVCYGKRRICHKR